MVLTGLATLFSVATQVTSGLRGRPLLIKATDFITYVCLSTAGIGFFLSGMASLFHGGRWWMAIPAVVWGLGITRLFQMYKNARYSPRCCEACGFSMVRMGRGERFLNKAQKIEEKLLSREYDLWVCTCGHRQLFVYPGVRGALFQKCRTCSVTAAYGVKETVTPQGIYIDTHCAACDSHVQL